MLEEILPKLHSLNIQTNSHKIIFNKDELSTLHKQGTWYCKECTKYDN